MFAARPTLIYGFAIMFSMNTQDSPHLVAVERIHNSLLLYFSNGKSGVYSDVLLYSILDQSETIPNDDESLSKSSLTPF
jgi:hypothetical protein